jgi:hypothetical protein
VPKMPKQTATSRRRGNGRRGSGSRAVRAFPETAAAASEAAPRGAATLTDGLDPLDQERASSLADEGGMAGAAVEAQPPKPVASVSRSAAGKLWLAASWGLAGLAALYLRRSR